LLSTSARQPSYLCFGLQRPGLAFLDGYNRKIKFAKFRSPKLRLLQNTSKNYLKAATFSCNKWLNLL
jgi:hypothetical protein